MKVVFFGTPAFAVPSLEALIASAHDVVAVVTQPDRRKGRGQQMQPTATKEVATAHGIAVLQPAKIRDAGFLDQIRALGADLGVVVAFGRILPDDLLAVPRLGMINVHGSVLPRYRGAAPIQRAVMNGDAETGVTIMRVEHELDAGAMFAVATAPIPPDATSGDMSDVLSVLGARLLIPVVDDLEAGRAVETPQDHVKATFAPKISKDEGTIDWSASAAEIHNRVRALQPWPLASTHLNGVRLVLRRTRARSGDPTSVGARSAGARSGDPTIPGARSADPPPEGSADLARASLAPGDGRSADLAPDDVGSADLAPGEARSADLARVDLAPGDVRSADLAPGTVVQAAADEIVVACGQGSLLAILELQPEGKRTMTAREFLAGRGVREGARFGA